MTADEEGSFATVSTHGKHKCVPYAVGLIAILALHFLVVAKPSALYLGRNSTMIECFGRPGMFGRLLFLTMSSFLNSSTCKDNFPLNLLLMTVILHIKKAAPDKYILQIFHTFPFPKIFSPLN